MGLRIGKNTIIMSLYFLSFFFTITFILKTMKTKLFTIDSLNEAAKILINGELLAFPSETVYGLGGDATKSQTLEKIFIAKGRPQDNPLIVHVSTIFKAKEIVENWTQTHQKLAEHFWPGPLTLICQRGKILSPLVSAGLSTVGIRIPSHPLALDLLEKVNLPIAGPSANLSGRPSPTSWQMVYDDLKEKIAGILTTPDPLEFGLESTVVMIEEERQRLLFLREGFVTQEDIKKILPHFVIEKGDELHKKSSPGCKYAHYQPKCNVFLISYKERIHTITPNTAYLLWQKSREITQIAIKDNWEIIESKENLKIYRKGNKKLWILCFHNLLDYANNFYKSLSICEKEDAPKIFAQDCPQSSWGNALFNRLSRASNHQYVKK